MGNYTPIILVVVVFAAFYFFSIRPQKKQEREVNEMRNSLTIGDEITTIGGILGRVVKVTEETVVIETSKDRSKLHILKTAIRSVDVHAADTIEFAEKAEKAAERAEKQDKAAEKAAAKAEKAAARAAAKAEKDKKPTDEADATAEDAAEESSENADA